MTGRPTTTGAATVVGTDGRAKAYRPIPADQRAAAIAAGLAAYELGDYFDAHELLEPAWMGTAEVTERAILQGLIKLAAAYVHGVRGNPTGIRKNLLGARARLIEGAEGTAPDIDIDIGVLITDIDARLADLDAHPNDPTLPPPALRRRHR